MTSDTPLTGGPLRARKRRTTREVVLPILEQGSGLRVGEDFNLAFSPERVDPGNLNWNTRNVPKVVGGITNACTERTAELYATAIDTVHRVSSPEAAELTKLLENIFRSVNVALVNELAQLCERMSIDVWEVVDAAATKPFGFMSFRPGPGLGGHCIPIDPFYLTWKAREFGFSTEFIELAGKVNESMPYFCRSLVSQALNHSKQKAMKGAEHGVHLRCVPLEPAAYDCVVIVTDHSSIDYERLVEDAELVVDLRNAIGARGRQNGKVWKL